MKQASRVPHLAATKATVCQQEHYVQPGMQLWITDQASFRIVQKDSLSARTLFRDWDTTMNHRARLVKQESTVCQQEHCVQTGCNYGS